MICVMVLLVRLIELYFDTALVLFMIVLPVCVMVDRMSGVIKMAELWLAPLLGAARCATSQLGDNKDMNSNPGRHHPPC